MLGSEIKAGGFRSACAAWLGDRDASIEPIAKDAFSGSAVIRVRCGDADGDIVLKSFPATARPRIEWVHGLMTRLRVAGCGEVPAVVVHRWGGTVFVDDVGRAWEAVRFVSGTATDRPSLAQARAAAAAVARFHLAAAAWPAAPARFAVPPAVTRRIEHAARMLSDPWSSLPMTGGSPTALRDAMAARAVQAAALARETGLDGVMRRVVAERSIPLKLHAVVRDIWSSHVLFAPDAPTRVSGVVDFHAAEIDTPATDLARLLGSWCHGPAIPDDPVCRDALAAYDAIRPLTADEHRLIPWLDATGTIIALDHWFRWTLTEGRRFECSARALGRVDRLLSRLPAAVAWLTGQRAGV